MIDTADAKAFCHTLGCLISVAVSRLLFLSFPELLTPAFSLLSCHMQQITVFQALWV